MRLIATLTLLLTIVFAVDAQEESAKISGSIINPTGEMVYLLVEDMVEGKEKVVYLDSTKLNSDGGFTLSTSLKEQRWVIFNDGNEMAKLLLAPGDNFQLTLNTKMFDETISYNGKGADKNNAIANLMLIEEKITTRMWTMVNDGDTSAINNYLNEAYDDYIAIINDYCENNEALGITKEHLVLDAKKNLKRNKRMAARQIEYLTFVGTLKGGKGVDFEGVDLEGNVRKVSDFKGKTTVIDFWATWCGPCKAEMPAYKELEEKYGRDINFLSVAVWCPEDEWKELAINYGFEHNLFISKGNDKEIREAYMLNFIPRYIVLDKDFNIIDGDAPRPSSGELQSLF